MTIARFTYDPFGRRVSKTTSTGTVYYVYDGEDILAEVDGAGTLLTYYVHGPGIDEPLAMVRGTQVSYYHADALGTITHLTNSSGAVVQTYNYDSFGNITAQSGSLTQPYTYTGREWDVETGLYYYRARYYNPQVGRFITEDPALYPLNSTLFGLDSSPIGAGWHLPSFLTITQSSHSYAYVENNPLNLSDPTGLLAWKECCVGGYKGEWQRVHWSRLINRLCICYWLCVPPETKTIWSGNPNGLPSTRGVIINNPRRGDGLKRGNDCLCPYPS